MCEPVEASTDDLIIDWHLDNWARWMRRGGTTRGYPGRASGCTSWGDAWDNDTVFDRMDSQKAACVDALVEGLTPAQKAALWHRYLDAVFLFPRHNYPQLLVFGRESISKGLKQRGMW